MNALVVGFGNLGMRHAQGLLSDGQIQKLFVVEQSDEVFARNCKTLGNILEHEHDPFIRVDKIDPSFDIELAVIATGANSHLSALQQCVQANFKNILLEKIPFNSHQDSNAAKDLLSGQSVDVRINTPRRLFPAYEDLKNQLKAVAVSKINVWGVKDLATNAIHFLDLFEFLFDQKISMVEVVEAEIYASKRPGYKDFSGSILAKNESACTFEIHSHSAKPEIRIELIGSDVKLVERFDTMDVALDAVDVASVKHPLYFQSQLTGQLVANNTLFHKLPTCLDFCHLNDLFLSSLPSELYSKQHGRFLVT